MMMKNKVRLLTAVCLLAGAVCLTGCTDTNMPDNSTVKSLTGKAEGVLKISVKTPGTLADQLKGINGEYKKMILDGDLNGSDIRALRAALGEDYEGNPTHPLADWLDISKARIVAGGDAYEKVYTNNPLFTQNDLVGVSMFETTFESVSKSYIELKHIDLPETTQKIDTAAFQDCVLLQSVTIPDGVKEINPEAFDGCTSLDNVQLPPKIRTLSENVFGSCTHLKSITLDDALDSISEWVFMECSSLSTLTLPDNLSYIGTEAFYDSGLQSVVLPPRIKKIENATFEACKDLKSVILNEALDSIKSGAFSGCLDLKSIALPDNLSFIGMFAFSNSGLQSITIPGKVRNIPAQGFSMCKHLKSVTFPPTLREIGEDSFTECDSLPSITLPQGLTTIKEDAFRKCNQLVQVHSHNIQPPALGKDVFADTPVTKVLYVPLGSKAAYEAAPEWKQNFSLIIEESYSPQKANKNVAKHI